ncbi:MAG: glycosyltransferase family 4 protein [bacterium]
MVVVSEHDRRRLGAPHVHVIPNGYAYQEQPVGRLAVGPTPVIMIPGQFTYRPNVDAARSFVSQILPLLQRRLPAVQVRLVGHAGPAVQQLHRMPTVTVTGWIPDITKELASADLIAVPIRFGGGSRIKILEAFAHRIPVVSTPAGVEGIEARDGRELLVAETVTDFAAACLSLLSDLEGRRTLVEAAHALFLERYRWDRIQEQIAALAALVAADGKQARPAATEA